MRSWKDLKQCVPERDLCRTSTDRVLALNTRSQTIDRRSERLKIQNHFVDFTKNCFYSLNKTRPNHENNRLRVGLVYDCQRKNARKKQFPLTLNDLDRWRNTLEAGQIDRGRPRCKSRDEGPERRGRQRLTLRSVQGKDEWCPLLCTRR